MTPEKKEILERLTMQASQFKSMLDQPAWALMDKRAKEKLGELLENLVTCKPEDLRFTQGQIKGIRYIMGHPLEVAFDLEALQASLKDEAPE